MSSPSTDNLRLSSRLINLIAIVVSAAAAYFMTIQSLRIDLAAKAETAAVQSLEKKLTGIEVLLREAVVDKEQFYDFSSSVETRLIRIEAHLVANAERRHADSSAGAD